MVENQGLLAMNTEMHHSWLIDIEAQRRTVKSNPNASIFNQMQLIIEIYRFVNSVIFTWMQLLD